MKWPHGKLMPTASEGCYGSAIYGSSRLLRSAALPLNCLVPVARCARRGVPVRHYEFRVANEVCADHDGLGAAGEYEQPTAGISPPADGPQQLAQSEWNLAVPKWSYQ